MLALGSTNFVLGIFGLIGYNISLTEKITEIYNQCPSGYHVDHIIPLQGKLVSGLHVHTNLQYLLPRDNLSKSNKFDIE